MPQLVVGLRLQAFQRQRPERVLLVVDAALARPAQRALVHRVEQASPLARVEPDVRIQDRIIGNGDAQDVLIEVPPRAAPEPL